MNRPTLSEQIDDYAISLEVAKDARSTREEFRRLEERIAELENENARFRNAIEFAHSEGFQWPSDPFAV